MKYTPETYAKALAQVLGEHPKKEEERLLKRFLGALKKNGDSGTLYKIIPIAESLMLKKAGNAKWVIETARPIPHAKRAVKALAKLGDVIQEAINPELIAGIRIIKNGERQFDGSLRRKIEQLFVIKH